ncbi:MAG: PIN domain-containing protein [Patescibacteria group bacterium]
MTDMRMAISAKRRAKLTVLIDTNIFVALYDKNDPTHKQAANMFASLPSDARLVTTSEIVGESITVIAMKVGKDFALRLISEIVNIELLFVEEIIFYKAIEVFKRIKSKNVSFVDCVSFVIAREKRFGIDCVFTFDRHFKTQGVVLLSDLV